VNNSLAQELPGFSFLYCLKKLQNLQRHISRRLTIGHELDLFKEQLREKRLIPEPIGVVYTNGNALVIPDYLGYY